MWNTLPQATVLGFLPKKFAFCEKREGGKSCTLTTDSTMNSLVTCWHTSPTSSSNGCALSPFKNSVSQKCFKHSHLIFQHLQMHLLSSKPDSHSPSSFPSIFTRSHRGYWRRGLEETQSTQTPPGQTLLPQQDIRLSVLPAPTSLSLFSWSR